MEAVKNLRGAVVFFSIMTITLYDKLYYTATLAPSGDIYFTPPCGESQDYPPQDCPLEGNPEGGQS